MHAASTSLLRRSHSARMEPWDVQAPRSPLAAVRRVIDSATSPLRPRCNVRPLNRQTAPARRRKGSKFLSCKQKSLQSDWAQYLTDIIQCNDQEGFRSTVAVSSVNLCLQAPK